MKNGFLIILGALLVSGNLLVGQPNPFDQDIRKFYLSADSVSGNRLLMERYQPNDPAFLRIVGYREFLHTLLYQSKSNYDRFFQQSENWLHRLEKVRSSSPSVNASLAEIHLYRSLLATHFTEYKSAAFELYDSYKILSRSGSKLIPADVNKLSGIIGVLLQQVPEQYIKYLRAVGVKPSGLRGLDGLKQYYTAAMPGSADKIEGYLLIITALKEFGKEPADAWHFIRKEGLLMLDNPFIKYQSALAALKAGDCASAVHLLDYGPHDKMPAAVPYWNYQLGRCKLYQNDPVAVTYFEKFLDRPGGDNYRHRVLLMTGWSYLIHNQPVKAKEYFQRVLTLSEPLTEFDQQAVREVKSGMMPDPGVIRARLLFDGGYYDSCQLVCDRLIQSGAFSGAGKGELIYRKARCEQRLGKDALAINSYLEVIKLADAIKSYLVPNAALQLGDLYKKAGQLELARKYYQVCLDLNHYGYREGIDRQAQIGLKELGK